VLIFAGALLAFCVSYYIHGRELLKRYISTYIALGVFLHTRLIWQVVYWSKNIANYVFTRAVSFEVSVIEFLINEHPLLLLGAAAAVLYSIFLLVGSIRRSEYDYVSFSDFYIILFIHPLFAFSVREWSLLIIADYVYYCLLWVVILIISRKKKKLLVYADRNKKQLGEFRQYIYAFYILFSMTRKNGKRTKIVLRKCVAGRTLSRKDMNLGKAHVNRLYKLLVKKTIAIISVAKDVADINTGKNTCSDQFLETCMSETKKACIKIEEANRRLEKWNAEAPRKEHVDINEFVQRIDDIGNTMNNPIYGA